MNKFRELTEWTFGKTVQYFAFLDFCKNLKELLQPVSKCYMWLVHFWSTAILACMVVWHGIILDFNLLTCKLMSTTRKKMFKTFHLSWTCMTFEQVWNSYKSQSWLFNGIKYAVFTLSVTKIMLPLNMNGANIFIIPGPL